MTRLDPRTVLLTALVASLVLGVIGPDLTRLVATVILAIILPGASMVYASGLDRRDDPLTTVVLVLGGGAAIGVLGAVLAALLPWGLGPVTGRLVPALVSLAAIAASTRLRPMAAAGDGNWRRTAGDTAVAVRAYGRRAAAHRRAWYVPATVAAVGVVAVLGAALISSGGRPATGPALSIVPDGERVVVSVDAGDSTGRYQLRLTAGAVTHELDLAIEPHERWVRSFAVNAPGQSIRATLNATEPGAPSLSVWLDPSMAPVDERRTDSAPAVSTSSGASG
jgi:hypothetical protein